MTFIQALLPAIARGIVSITFKATADEQLRISFTMKSDEDQIPIPAFSFVASKADAEQQLVEAIAVLSEHRSGSIEAALAEAKATMDAAAQESKASAALEKTAAAEKMAKIKANKPAGSKTATDAKSRKPSPSFESDDDSNDDESGDADDNSSAASTKSAPAVAPTVPELFG